MIDRQQAAQLVSDHIHLESIDSDDLGSVEQVFVDETGQATFCTVARPGQGCCQEEAAAQIVVALQEAVPGPDRIRVPYASTFVRRAPTACPGESLTAADLDTLLAYYGVPAEDCPPLVPERLLEVS